MRFFALLVLSFIVPVLGLSACGSASACEGAATALCVRAIACNGADQAAFISGSTTDPGGYMAANYGPQNSCEDQLQAKCPSTDLTPDQQTAYSACENAAPSGVCGMVPGTVGVRLPDACVALFPVIAK